MKKYTVPVFFLLFTITAALRASPEPAPDKEQKDLSPAWRAIDIWLEAQRDYDKLPGLSAAIARDQKTIWSRGYGMADLEKEVRAEPATIYSICSISKLFTSIAIMQLHDAGKLSLEDRVADLLPWFDLQQQWKDSGPITVRTLLTHSSGLPREADYPYWTGPDFPFPSPEQVKKKLGGQTTLYPASTYFQYSNLGLTLLGEIVAEVSGKPYDQYIEENILKPLRLTDTRTNLPESLWRGKLATGYSALKRDGSRDMLPLFQAKGIKPAAGFSSTAENLARFASWQFRLLENGGKEILKSSTLREMHRVHWMDPDWKTSWGLGFSVYEVDGRTFVGHGGSCPGYRSTLMIDPQKKWAFVVMINAQGVNPGGYAEGMREILKKAENAKAEAADKKADLEAYAGTYEAQPWWGETAVFPWYGKLAVLGLPSQNPARGMTLLKYMGDDRFRRIRSDDTLGEEVLFERDEEGKVIRMWQHSNYKNRLK
ncbi:MAG: serine hydrolase [Candidatus Aminicenantes bacterium]|nr:serine hydrolase [Candidatus Aminicenantes bacterium]